MNVDEELTIEDIVNLKSTCSKKVFDNFIQQKYSKTGKPENADNVDKPKKKSKADLEFEKVFGCERPKDYKSSIDKRAFQIDNEPEEQVDDEDKPDQMTTKYRPRKFREVYEVKEGKNLRDPRFERSSGYFNQKRFDKSYNFVKEARDNDKKLLKKTLKKVKDEDRKKEITKVIQRISNQEQSEKQLLEKQKIRNQLIEEKKKRLKDDTKPVHLNKGEIKKKELIETFKNLKQSKKLTKYLEKKRKKNTSREKRSFLSASRD